VEHETVGRGGTVGGDGEEGTEDHLGEFVRFGIRHDEKHKGRNKGILGLEH
jgi:hypothetical protein